MTRKPPYANVIAGLALFIALGGTAAAATLERDSVGSPQIRADAVRSPEIRSDAVRSSEIRDESILLGDLSPGARTALGTKLRFAQEVATEVTVCPGKDLTACPTLLQRTLAPGSWLIQAKLVAFTPDGTANAFDNRCGLVTSDAVPGPRVLDEARVSDLGNDGDMTPIALLGVVTGVEGNPAVGLRCTLGEFEAMELEDLKITAVEVGSVTGL